MHFSLLSLKALKCSNVLYIRVSIHRECILLLYSIYFLASSTLYSFHPLYSEETPFRTYDLRPAGCRSRLLAVYLTQTGETKTNYKLPQPWTYNIRVVHTGRINCRPTRTHSESMRQVNIQKHIPYFFFFNICITK